MPVFCQRVGAVAIEFVAFLRSLPCTPTAQPHHDALLTTASQNSRVTTAPVQGAAFVVGRHPKPFTMGGVATAPTACPQNL